jgi:predicted amidohydrolase YtcJ
MEVVVGDILTMDPDCPRVEAMAVVAGTILATGTVAQVRAVLPSGVAHRELPGVIVPGLIDSHLHLQWAGLKLLRIAGEVGLTPTEALAVLESEPFSDPWLDGVPTLEQRLAALRLIQPLMLALGVTAVVDPAVVPAEMAAYVESHRRGELTLSVTAMPHPDLEPGVAGAIAALDGIGVRTGMGDDRLRLGGVKVYFDGVGMGATALRREPWPQTGERGLQRVSAEAFHQLARWCARAGWSLGVHVVGGGGIDIVLDVFSRVDAVVPIRGRGFTLIHAYLEPSGENMATAAALGVLVAAQPSIHYTNGSRLVRALGASAESANPLADWLAAGVTVGGGSDGQYFPLDPRLGLWQSRTRRVRDAEHPHAPEQALTAEQALALYTTGAAAVALADGRRGRLAPGYAADWTVLPLDPLTADPDAIRELWPLETTVAGSRVHSATADVGV